MKKEEAVLGVQRLLESRGYIGNSDDGEAVVDYLIGIGMLPPVIDRDFGILYNGDASIERVSAWEPPDENS